MISRVALACGASAFAVLILRLAACGPSAGVDGTSEASTRDSSNPVVPDDADVPLDGGATTDWDTLDGWVPYAGFAPECPLYVPADGTAVSSIVWEACPPSAAQTSADCKSIVTDPAHRLSTAVGEAIGSKVNIGLYAGDGTKGTYLFFDGVSGVVRTAIRITASPDCTPDIRSVKDDRYAFTIHYSRTAKLDGYGLLAGSLADRGPSVAYRYPDSHAHDQKASGSLGIVDFFESSTIRALPWAAPDSGVDVWSSANDGLQHANPWTYGARLFWRASSSNTVSKIMRYDGDAAVVDFLSYAPDPMHGVADLGTDGTDFVWFDGTNPDTKTALYKTVSIMTAPYVDTSVAIVPRRLRSETMYAFGGAPFTVGCGRAAFATGDGIRVTRLSDGVSWMLSNQKPPGWSWTGALALTCDEVFAAVVGAGDGGPQLNVARVRLSTLSPEIAPD